MENTQVIVTGIKEIDRKLKKLAPAVQKKVARQSMRKGMKVIAQEMKAQVPVETGLTRSAVKVRAAKGRKRGSIELEVVIDGKTDGLIKTSPNGNHVFYPALIEYGDKDLPPDPFGRRTYDNKAKLARDTTMASLLAGVEQEARK